MLAVDDMKLYLPKQLFHIVPVILIGCDTTYEVFGYSHNA